MIIKEKRQSKELIEEEVEYPDVFASCSWENGPHNSLVKFIDDKFIEISNQSISIRDVSNFPCFLHQHVKPITDEEFKKAYTECLNEINSVTL